jgi:hypothetical protein
MIRFERLRFFFVVTGDDLTVVLIYRADVVTQHALREVVTVKEFVLTAC